MIVVTDNGAIDLEEPATPTVIRQPQFTFVWTGTDGVEWDLGAGPAYLLTGTRGYGMPLPQHFRRPSLGHGTSYNGTRILEREVYMPVEIHAEEFLSADSAFAAGLSPFGTGTLRVTQPTGEWREIVCRYDSGADLEMDGSPLFDRRMAYQIYMTAEDPFWRGKPIVTSFKHEVDENARPTFPPAGTPLSFYRSRSDHLDDRGTVTNPGDIEVRAIWRVSGPFTSFNVGVNDQTVNLTYTKTAGQWVEIDMTAGTSSVVDESGRDLRDFASDLDFPSIPAGESELTTTVVGSGPGTEVSVSFVPRFFRAW